MNISKHFDYIIIKRNSDLENILENKKDTSCRGKIDWITPSTKK